MVEGRNVAIEYRWARRPVRRLPALAAESGRPAADVIARASAQQRGRAAKRATATIPIVFVDGRRSGRRWLRRQPGRPGGNVTGVTALRGRHLPARGWNCSSEIVPDAERVAAMLANPNNPSCLNSDASQTLQAAALAHRAAARSSS